MFTNVTLCEAVMNTTGALQAHSIITLYNLFDLALTIRSIIFGSSRYL